jgi:hypothetical protein
MMRVTIEQINGFIGIPYRRDGMDRTGVSCLGLVVLVYRDLLGVALPFAPCQTPEEIVGSPLHRLFAPASVPSPLDVALMESGTGGRHVGLYTPWGILHASEAHGVALSSPRIARVQSYRRLAR